MEATSGVQDGVLAGPSGGGALRSIGESFQPDLLRGSGTYAVPIDVPSGPNGLRPQLGLRYSTGQGNGPYGVGWQLGGPPSIVRGTEGGVPRYTDDDPLLLGGDVLVDVGDGRFRPRSDTQHWDIRREGDGWRLRTKEGQAYLLGASPEARISADDGRVFGWLCEEQVDQAGNRIRYRYLRDRGQLYLSEVEWGIFALRMQHEPRPDALRDGRAGFPIVTALRCARIERHTSTVTPSLCATHQLRYRQAPGSLLSLLTEVQLEAPDGGDPTGTELYPPVRLSYSDFQPEPRLLPVTSEDGVLPLGRPDTALVDLTGDGLPDLLQTDRSGHRFWENLGGHFAAARTLPGAPLGLQLGEPGVSFADLNGDGTADLIRAGTRLSTIARNTGAGRWSDQPQVLLEQLPLAISAATTRLVDLDGDGTADLLQSGVGGFTVAYQQGDGGWTAPEVLSRVHDLDRFPDVDLADPSVYLTDMVGDGLTDVVSVQSGWVCYWPSYGYGHWGDRVDMTAPPTLPRGFSRDRLFLTDLDGSGTSDLLYVDGDRILYWLNQSGGGWSDRFELAFVPPPNVEALYPVDLLGTGVHGLCWASAGTSGPPARFLDLSSGTKPYLMTSIDNGFGGRTSIDYTTSSALRSAARTGDPGGSDPWGSFLPFPLHVVAGMRDEDLVTGQTTETRFSYQRGYHDPVSRVFRGFETVETRNLGDAYTPTVVQQTRFSLGAMLGPEERYRRTARERAQDHALCGSPRQVSVLEEHPDGTRTLVSTAVTDYEVREEFVDGDRFVFFPHLVTTTATDTVVDPGGHPVERIDTATYDYDAFGNVTRKRRVTRFGTDPVAAAQVSEQRITYAANEAAWLVGLPSRLSMLDGDAHLVNDKLIRYDGADFTGLASGQVTAGMVTRTEELVLADWALPVGYADVIDPSWGLVHHTDGWYAVREAYAHDAAGNVSAQRDSLGRTTTIAYDADGVFPLRATSPVGTVTSAVFDPRVAQPLAIVSGTNEVRFRYSALGRLHAQLETAADGTVQLTQYFRAIYADLAGKQPAQVVSVKPHEPGATVAQLDATDLADPAGVPGFSVEHSFFDGRGNVLQRSRQAARASGGWILGARRVYTRNNLSGEELPNLAAATPAFQLVVADGTAVRFRYGPTGQVTRLDHPDGGRFLVAHLLDRVEKRDAETADDAPPLVEHYDALGHLVGVDTPDGQGAVLTQRYSVDQSGRILSVVDATGQTTATYTYAGPGPAITTSHQEAGTRTYHRDATGTVRRRADSSGTVLTYDYDDQGRLTEVTDRSAAAQPVVVRRHTYDATGLVSQDEAGLTTTYVNDRLGRPTRTVVRFGADELALERTYGLQSEVRTLRYPDSSQVDLSTYAGGEVRGIAGLVESIDYDVHGNPLELDFGAVRTAYDYDPAMKRLLTLQLRRGATPVRRLAFTYDRNGCITTSVDTLAATTTGRRYAYDALFRLTGMRTFDGGLGGALVRSDTYAYGVTGDVVTQADSGSALHYDDPLHPSRLTSVVDPAGTRTATHDAAGRLTDLGDLTGLTYDVWDRLVGATLADGSTIALAYDGSGRQVRRTLTRPDGTTSETRSIEGLYEQSETGSRSSVYVGTLLVALRTTPVGGATVTRAVLTDHLGSILTTVELGAGTVRQQVYSPFGLSTMAATDDSRYTGVAPDAELGLVQMGARWYSPQLGRFITPDWFIIESPTHGQRLPQSLNVYSYAINNPIMLRDPSGKFFGLDDLIVAAVGFVVGFVTGVIVGIAEGRSFGDTLLLGLEAGLCGAAGAWLAYITVGAATSALGVLGMGMGGGVTTGIGIGAAVVGGLNGVISGSLQIYDWGSPVGWLAFIADSTWGLVGTTFAVLMHGVNLFYGDSQYNFGESRRKNRHIYDGGFGFSTFAFTQGNVTSNLNHKGQSLIDHETSHIWTSRLFGPVFQVTYVAWLVVGGIVGGLIGIGLAIAGKQSIGDSIMDVGYYDNPWESWAYDVGGTPKGGKLSWT